MYNRRTDQQVYTRHERRFHLTSTSDVQEFARTFCLSIRASTPKCTSPTGSATSSGQGNASTNPFSISQSVPATSLAVPTASPSTTGEPTANMLGAEIDGTKWKPSHGSSNANRGPAIEAVPIFLFIVATSVVSFR